MLTSKGVSPSFRRFTTSRPSHLTNQIHDNVESRGEPIKGGRYAVAYTSLYHASKQTRESLEDGGRTEQPGARSRPAQPEKLDMTGRVDVHSV
jgi:hypothetical protein